MLAVILAVFVVVAAAIYIEHKKKEPTKIFGVYTQPGKWYYLKYLIFLTVLSVRKFKSKNGYGGSGLGRDNRKIEDLEQPQPLSNHDKAIDAVFFQAVNVEGFYFCGGLEIRHQGKANGLFYIVVPGVGLLNSEKLPNTVLEADLVSVHTRKEYSAEGIHFALIEPMKKWSVSYEGKMSTNVDQGKEIDVKLEGTWTSDLPFFMFDTEMSSRALARAIAREKWSRKFFDTLKAAHQSHYEQMGRFKGKLLVDGKEHTLDMDAFRDHSFAYKRDWSLMHRYAYHVIYLETGMRAVIGVISQPCTTSHLEMGYVVHPDRTLHAIESCNLKLYHHGEKGYPGLEIGFSFKANGETFDVKATTEYEAEHFKGNNIEARLIERFLKCEVNGIPGKGFSEWHYNNTKM